MVNSKALAEFGHGEEAVLMGREKLEPFIHRVSDFPGHGVPPKKYATTYGRNCYLSARSKVLPINPVHTTNVQPTMRCTRCRHLFYPARYSGACFRADAVSHATPIFRVGVGENRKL